MPITVDSLHIYPVKSCRGIDLQSAAVSKCFELDRYWMITKPSGEMYTQRTHPQLALIETALQLTGSASTAPTQIPIDAYTHGGRLILRAPGMPDTTVVFPQTQPGKPVLAQLHGKKKVDALDEGDEIAAWLTMYLGFETRLVVKDMGKVRPLNPLHVPARRYFDHEPQTAMADGYPFLLLSTASISDLNKRLAERNAPSVSLRNFRPNIVVSSTDHGPYFEDTLFQISIAGHDLFIASRCTRCTLPNNDPNTGIAHKKEPLATMMSYRRVDPGASFSACLGMNTVNVDQGWSMERGDTVLVKREGDFHDRKGVWRGQAEPHPVIKSAELPVHDVASLMGNVYAYVAVTAVAVVAVSVVTRWVMAN
ncbi:hypothetical protein PhCBS80983_g01293 [Powellomyces hirtus]|uniref:MOSC domain-containing protein n=1 Tax=Powellomyces hirtus TaxID=109895 RepID=A0A507ECX2_9FUNG|nr:hypothetical protein PhCBS80983_g01293 [Powellomyces hirtus]